MASFGEEDTIPGVKEDDMIPGAKEDDMIPKTDDMIPTWTESETKSPNKAAPTKKVVSTTVEESSHKCPQCDKTVFRVEQLLCAGKYWHKTCFQCGGRGGRGCGRKLTSTNCSVQEGEPYCRNCYGQFLVKTASNEEAIRAADSGQARKEMPSLLAGVKVSERANLFLGGGNQNGVGASPARGLGAGAQSNKCVHCGKSVYPAEELRAQSMLWHKACFTCGALSEVGCHRVLPKDNFSSHMGVPFCKACFSVWTKDNTFRGISHLKVHHLHQVPVAEQYGSILKTAAASSSSSSSSSSSHQPSHHHHASSMVGASPPSHSFSSGSHTTSSSSAAAAAGAMEGETMPTEDDELDPDEQIQLELERELEMPQEDLKRKAAIYSADEDVAGAGVITKVQGEADYLSGLPPQQPFSPQQMTTGLATTVVLTGFTAPFDKNGVLYYLGTNGGLEAYQNPHLIGAVTASMSSIYKGSVHNVVEQKRSIMPNYSNNTKRSWVAVDLGKGRRLVPTRYCVRHGASGRGNAIRNWELRARERDTDGWTVLRAHYNDDAISELPYSAAAWKLRPPKTEGQRTWADGLGFRYFLILQLGPNSSGNDCFFIGGMELYGTLTMDPTIDAR